MPREPDGFEACGVGALLAAGEKAGSGDAWGGRQVGGVNALAHHRYI